MAHLDAILLMLACGLPLVLLMQRLRISALIAYLATGALVGPFGPWPLVQLSTLQPLAEAGAALLLFAIGLEFDLDAVRRRLRPILVASTTQIVLTIVVGAAAALLVGLAFNLAIALGACLAMSSTVMLLRVFDERRLRFREESHLPFGVALMQDIALGPLLLLLSLLIPVGDQRPVWLIATGLAGCVIGTVAVRRILATLVFSRIRAAQLPELEVAFAVTLALGAAALTSHCGLGSALGAFCAGLACGDKERSSVEAATRPLAGLMAVIFFMAMGAQFDVAFVRDHVVEVFTVGTVAVALKAPICGLALRVAGMGIRPAIGYGLALATIGEFAFVLAAAAFGANSDPNVKHLHQLVVAVTCISLAATPVLMLLAMPFLPRPRAIAAGERGGTVVVAGLGPVGNHVVDALREDGADLLLIDRNDKLLAAWQGVARVRTHRGRIEDLDDWLPVLGQLPRLIVLTFPVADTSAAVARRLKAVAPDLLIVARAPYRTQVDLLRAAGAGFVICDEQATADAILPILREALRLTPTQDSGPETGLPAHPPRS